MTEEKLKEYEKYIEETKQKLKETRETTVRILRGAKDNPLEEVYLIEEIRSLLKREKELETIIRLDEAAEEAAKADSWPGRDEKDFARIKYGYVKLFEKDRELAKSKSFEE